MVNRNAVCGETNLFENRTFASQTGCQNQRQLRWSCNRHRRRPQATGLIDSRSFCHARHCQAISIPPQAQPAPLRIINPQSASAESAMATGKAEPVREAVNFAHRKKAAILIGLHTSRTDGYLRSAGTHRQNWKSGSNPFNPNEENSAPGVFFSLIPNPQARPPGRKLRGQPHDQAKTARR